MNAELIAPCGMNCGLCGGYLALKHKVKDQGIQIPYCTGCRVRNKQCAFIKKRCQRLLQGDVKFCFECDDFPCPNLVKLDTRYKTNFRMSMIENLKYIQKHGIESFLTREQKWRCPRCGGMICCHNGLCFNCDLETLRQKKSKYRWE